MTQIVDNSAASVSSHCQRNSSIATISEVCLVSYSIMSETALQVVFSLFGMKFPLSHLLYTCKSWSIEYPDMSTSWSTHAYLNLICIRDPPPLKSSLKDHPFGHSVLLPCQPSLPRRFLCACCLFMRSRCVVMDNVWTVVGARIPQHVHIVWGIYKYGAADSLVILENNVIEALCYGADKGSHGLVILENIAGCPWNLCGMFSWEF